MPQGFPKRGYGCRCHRVDDVAARWATVVPADPGFGLHELSLLRLRTLLTLSHRDETGYRKYAKDYAALADSLGFQAHMAQARAPSSWPAGNVS
jgi:hypothetical protein